MHVAGAATMKSMSVAVVIPCYRVVPHVLNVIGRIGPEVSAIYAVDDACPDGSGDHIESNNQDPRVKVLRHPKNQGVGGATMTGYKAAVADGHDILVKLDGDGQMRPEILSSFTQPIEEGIADYTKGNRFYDLTHIGRMPAARIFGNAILSFMSKLSTGYWDIFDPTNGYTAVHAKVVAHLQLSKISTRYFFESDMLFRLNLMRCVVLDIPMDSQYGEEVSSLKIKSILGEFLKKHLQNTGKRIFYNYYLRDLSPASLNLVLGIAMALFGAIYGGVHWYQSAMRNVLAPAGTVMIAALPLILGMQLLLSFLTQDMQSTPRQPIHRRLS